MTQTQVEYLVDWENDSIFMGDEDDISADVVEARWFLGMKQAYQDAADESTLTLKVRNTNGKYNPENSSSPLYGNVAPRRRVAVRTRGTGLVDNLQAFWTLDEEQAGGDSELLTDMVSWWKLDETSGTRYDAHGSNDLTDNNTVGYTTGKQGNGASFVAASSEFLSHTSNASLQMGNIDFEISFWVKLNTTGSIQRLVSKWGATGNQDYMVQYHTSGTTFRFVVTHDGTTLNTVSSTSFGTPSTGVWYHILAWHDAVNNEIGISVNGTANVTSHTTGVFTGTADLQIGGNTAFLDGAMDEVAIWKRLLTTDEKTALYNGGSGLSYDSLPPSASAVDRVDSQNNYELTENGIVLSGSGKLSNGAVFDADTANYLSSSDAVFSPGDANFCLVGWVKLNSKSSDARLWGKWGTSNQEHLLWYDQSADRFVFSVSDDGSAVVSVEADTFGSPSTGVLYFLAVWHDATNNQIGIRVNASTDTAAHSTGVYQGSAAFIVGGDADAPDAIIDHLGFWDAVLSKAQLDSLYNSGSGLAFDQFDIVYLWTGWVSRVEVEWRPAGANTGETFATINCEGMQGLLRELDVNLELQEDKTADEIIEDVFVLAGFPPAAEGVFIVGVSEIGGGDVIASASDYKDFETGTVIFSYYGDVRDERTDGYKTIIDVTRGERGRFFFDRRGRGIFWNREHVQNLGLAVGVVDESGAMGEKPIGVDYKYGNLISNVVVVTAHPRVEEAAEEGQKLWELDGDTITIPALGEVTIEAKYIDAYKKHSGAIQAAIEEANFASGTALVNAINRGDRTIVTLVNESAGTPAVLDTLAVSGDVLTTRHPITIRKQDDTSVTAYGRRGELSFNLNMIQSYEDAEAVADYELARRKDPTAWIRSVSFRRAANDVDNAFLLNHTIGDRINVILDSLGHDGDHVIIGEQHVIREGGKVHQVTFYMEPVYAGY